MTYLDIIQAVLLGLDNGTLYYHHSARRKGYVRKNEAHFEKYEGRFGKGFIHKIPNSLDTHPHKSNNYYTIEYLIYDYKTKMQS